MVVLGNISYYELEEIHKTMGKTHGKTEKTVDREGQRNPSLYDGQTINHGNNQTIPVVINDCL